MQDQFNEYVKSKGKEPSEITEEEKAELQNKMAGDLFPGESSHASFLPSSYPQILVACKAFHFHALLQLRLSAF